MKCPDCKGTGLQRDDTKLCERCDGDGVIREIKSVRHEHITPGPAGGTTLRIMREDL